MNILKALRHTPAKIYNPETKSYRERVLANGGTISERSTDAVEKFVQDCKNAQIWSKLLEVGPFAGNNLSAALVKLVHPAGVPGVLTNVNFVAGDYQETGPNGGLAGDGSTKHLNTGFNAQAHMPDNAHLSCYLREDVSASGNRAMMGAFTTPDHYWLGALLPASAVNARLGQVSMASTADGLSKGFYLGSRTAANQLKLYKNGVTAGSDATAVTHTKPNLNVVVFAFNSGPITGYIPARASFYSIGAGLNDVEALGLHLAVRTLQRNLGREIN